MFVNIYQSLRQLLFPVWAGGFASSGSPDFAISVTIFSFFL